MYLKPTKSYGKEYRCKIYKHFIENVKSYDNINTKPLAYIKIVSKTGYRVYRTSAYSLATYVESAELVVKENFNYVAVKVDKVGQCVKFGNEIFKLTSLPKDITTNDPTYEIIESGDFKGDLIHNTIDYESLATIDNITPLIKQYELNKYYYFGDLSYMPIDDIQDSQEQYLKGNIVKTQTRTIRYDIESELEIHDVVVIDNVAYIVEDIFTHTKVGLNMYKTYTATLMKLGV
jgi:hypothetical protein